MKAISTIKNPLTIIAIFAGLAEVSGTAVLPLLDPGAQQIYVWFLMIFPCLLIGLFFLTLNLNHKVLYAPSDFQDESHFVHLLKPMGAKDKDQKIKNEMRNIVFHNAGENVVMGDKYQVGQAGAVGPKATSKNNVFRSKYLLAEQQALSSIESELGVSFQSNVEFAGKNATFTFDGVAVKDEQLTVVQVKYLPSIMNVDRRLREAVHPAEAYVKLLEKRNIKNKEVRLIVALVTDSISAEEELRKHYRERTITRVPSLQIDFRFFHLNDDNESPNPIN